MEESEPRRGPKARVYLSYRVPGAGCEPSCIPTAWVTKTCGDRLLLQVLGGAYEEDAAEHDNSHMDVLRGI
jgi:hypothetical protein